MTDTTIATDPSAVTPQATDPSAVKPQVTEPFLTTSGDYFGVVLGVWMRRYGWLMALPMIGFGVLGAALHDERWWLVALMLVFIICPMVMSFIYTYYMLTPEARRAILPKRVTIVEGQSITLTYLPLPKENIEDTSDCSDLSDLSDLSDSSDLIPWSDVLKVSSTPRFRVYQLRGERMQFLLIPWNKLVIN